MTKFFFKFKKIHFWPLFGPFPQLWGAKKKNYSEKSGTHNLIRSNDPIPRKQPNRQHDG